MGNEANDSDLPVREILDYVRRRARRYRLKVLVSTFAIYLFQITSVLAGIIAATLTAVNPTRFTVEIILVSGAGSASAALLARLRLAEYSRAREIGRVGYDDALLKARINLPRSSDPKADLTTMRRRIRAIEYDQIELLTPKESREEDRDEAKDKPDPRRRGPASALGLESGSPADRPGVPGGRPAATP